MAAVVSPTVAPTRTHPLYDLWAPVWTRLAHVYEGTGGFLDGTYLVPHPREWKDYAAPNPKEPTKKLMARRRLARYENVAATIIEQKRSALFRESVTRTVGPSEKTVPHPLEEWWLNVDGAGLAIDDWMMQAWTLAGVFGFVIHVMDRPMRLDIATKADEPAPYLRLYSPLDMPDWITNDRDELQAVRLMEAEPRTTLDDALPVSVIARERQITREEWRLTRGGTLVESGPHGFGTLPVVLHYAARRALASIVGKSVLNDPQLYIDLYNLTSEIRELLRLQTFGLLNAPLGSGPEKTDISTAKDMLGTESGAENVMFSPEPVNYVQPDTSNVTVYQQEREFVLRTIYRLAAIPWASDSKAAEAAASLALKREDMNQILASYADECERTEYQIARLWFRATYGPDRWEEEWDAADVVIRYPESFNITPFAEVLQQAQAALSLDMGPKFLAELKRRLVAKFIPDAPQDILQAINEEIDKLVLEEVERKAQREQLTLQALKQTPDLIPRPPKMAA